MSATEIYICHPGQQLKEGKLEMSHDIYDKDGAKEDAARRAKADPTIDRIAYYQVTEDGKFRIFYTYKNPNPRPVKKSPKMGDIKATGGKGKAKPKSWWSKLFGG